MKTYDKESDYIKEILINEEEKIYEELNCIIPESKRYLLDKYIAIFKYLESLN